MNNLEALFMAAGRGDVGAMKVVLAKGFDVTAHGLGQATALHVAASRGHVRCVDFLLQAGADPNARDIQGRTPLHEAAFVREQSHQTWNALVAGGARDDIPDRDGHTPASLSMSLDYGKALVRQVNSDRRAVAQRPAPVLGR